MAALENIARYVSAVTGWGSRGKPLRGRARRAKMGTQRAPLQEFVSRESDKA